MIKFFPVVSNQLLMKKGPLENIYNEKQYKKEGCYHKMSKNGLRQIVLICTASVYAFYKYQQ